jgi:YVTN family beta-propeller protein
MRQLSCAIAGVILLAACGDSAGPEPEGPSLIVFPDTVRIQQFGTQQLAVTVVDADGNPMTGFTFAYTSQAQSLASVSSAGLVTSLGPAGETAVTVGGAGLTRQVPVEVEPIPSVVIVTPGSVRIRQGTSGQLTVVVLDATGDTIADPAVTFAVANPAIATVSPAGQIQAQTPGTTQITVSCGNADGNVSVTVTDGAILGSTFFGGRPFGVAIAASGAGYVLSQDLNQIARITLPDTNIGPTIPLGIDPTDADFHPSGATLYVTNQFSGYVSVVDVATNAQVGTISIPSGSLFRVAVAPDGSTLWVTTNVGIAYVVDLGTAEVIDSVAVGAVPNGIAFHPTDPIVYVSDAAGGGVREISTTTNLVLRTFAVGGIPQDIAVSADGSELYIANESLGLQVWNAVTGASITTVNLSGGGFGIALSPDDTRIVVTQPASGRVRFVDRATRTIVKTVVTSGMPRRAAFAADGSIVVVPNEGDWFDVISN